MAPTISCSSAARAMFALVALRLLAAPAAAGEVVRRDFPDLVARAEQIVIGTVTAIREAPDASGAPETLVTLADLSVLKGEVGPELTLHFYGGQAGGVAVRIADMPTFTVGERDVLFVAGNPTAICPLVGIWQGRFSVRFDPALGTEIVEDHAHNPVTGLSPSARRGAQAASATPMTLDGFRQRIADELAQPSGTPIP